MIVDEKDVTLMTRLIWESLRLQKSGATLEAMRERAKTVLLELHARGWRSGAGENLLEGGDELYPIILYLKRREDVHEIAQAFERIKPEAITIRPDVRRN